MCYVEVNNISSEDGTFSLLPVVMARIRNVLGPKNRVHWKQWCSFPLNGTDRAALAPVIAPRSRKGYDIAQRMSSQTAIRAAWSWNEAARHQSAHKRRCEGLVCIDTRGKGLRKMNKTWYLTGAVLFCYYVIVRHFNNLCLVDDGPVIICLCVPVLLALWMWKL